MINFTVYSADCVGNSGNQVSDGTQTRAFHHKADNRCPIK